jgi:hypothetical protein
MSEVQHVQLVALLLYQDVSAQSLYDHQNVVSETREIYTQVPLNATPLIVSPVCLRLVPTLQRSIKISIMEDLRLERVAIR